LLARNAQINNASFRPKNIITLIFSLKQRVTDNDLPEIIVGAIICYKTLHDYQSFSLFRISVF